LLANDRCPRGTLLIATVVRAAHPQTTRRNPLPYVAAVHWRQGRLGRGVKDLAVGKRPLSARHTANNDRCPRGTLYNAPLSARHTYSSS